MDQAKMNVEIESTLDRIGHSLHDNFTRFRIKKLIIDEAYKEGPNNLSIEETKELVGLEKKLAKYRIGFGLFTMALCSGYAYVNNHFGGDDPTTFDTVLSTIFYILGPSQLVLWSYLGLNEYCKAIEKEGELIYREMYNY